MFMHLDTNETIPIINMGGEKREEKKKINDARLQVEQIVWKQKRKTHSSAYMEEIIQVEKLTREIHRFW